MGTFLNSIHVFIPPTRPDALDALVQKIRSDARRDGRSEVVDDDDTRPAQGVFLFPGERWITVCDEASEDHDQKALDALAKKFSRVLSTYAISALLHDGDVLVLHLFENGQRIDRMNSDPGYFNERAPSKADRATAGQPELWGPLLSPGCLVGDLAAAWPKGTCNGEGILSETARLLGINPDLAFMTYKDADSELPVAGTSVLEPGVVIRPVWLRFLLPTQRQWGPDTPPAFSDGMSSYSPSEATVGADVIMIISVRSTGGPTKGVHVQIWGDVIECGLLTVTSLEVVVSSRSGSTRRSGQVKEWSRDTGQRVLGALLPDVDIPAGPEGVGSSAATLETMLARLTDSTYTAPKVEAVIRGRGLKAGQGSLYLAIVAVADPGVHQIFSRSYRVEPECPS